MLTWKAPAECAQGPAVERTIELWLSQSPVPVHLHELEIEGHVRHEGAGYRLELRIASSSGSSSESLYGEHCRTLVEVVALKAALAADPTTLIERSEPRPSHSSEGLPTVPARRSRAKVVLSVRVTGDATIGLLPQPGFGFALSTAVERGIARGELGVRYLFPERARYAHPEGVGVDVGLRAGVVRGCLLPRIGKARLGTCGGIELGVMRGEGVGVAETRVSKQAWLAFELGPVLKVPVHGPIALWAQAGALLQLTRVTYHIRNLPKVLSSDRAAFQASLGLEARLR